MGVDIMQTRKAVLFARVSTKEQEELGHSLPAQMERLREYAKRKGFEVIREFSFSESAGLKIRHRFEEVLAYLRSQKTMPALLCQNVDRITRNFRDAVDLDDMRLKEGLEVHFTQENFVLNGKSTGTELFMWETKVFMAKQYINRLTDDANRSIQYKLQNGECISLAPLGYLNVDDPQTGRSTVILDKERAFLMKRLFLDYSTGAFSQREMADKANQWGLRTIKGNAISVQTINKILSNPFYCGLQRVKGQLYPHIYPTLIDKDVFDACQKGRAKPVIPQQGAHKPKIEFALRGLVTCAVSGRKVSCELHKGRYVYLMTRRPDDPTKKMWVKEEVVLEQIKAVLRSITLPDDLLASVLDYIRDSHEAEKAFHHKRLASLRDESESLTTKLDRLTDMLISQRITTAEYDRNRKTLVDRQQEVGRLLAESHEADNQFKIALSGLVSLASKAVDLFESSEPAEKRAIIGFVFQNLQLEGETLHFSLRKPFDLLANLAGCQEWRGSGETEIGHFKTFRWIEWLCDSDLHRRKSTKKG